MQEDDRQKFVAPPEIRASLPKGLEVASTENTQGNGLLQAYCWFVEAEYSPPDPSTQAFPQNRGCFQPGSSIATNSIPQLEERLHDIYKAGKEFHECKENRGLRSVGVFQIQAGL
jgi:hypothetical protein